MWRRKWRLKSDKDPDKMRKKEEKKAKEDERRRLKEEVELTYRCTSIINPFIPEDLLDKITCTLEKNSQSIIMLKK